MTVCIQKLLIVTCERFSAFYFIVFVLQATASLLYSVQDFDTRDRVLGPLS